MHWKDRYKLVIFDCDGTLVDSERISNRLIADMMNELGISMNEEKSLNLFKGTHFGKILDYIDSSLGKSLDFDFEKEYRRRCRISFETELKEIKGARRFIQNLTVPVCVASNGPQDKMESSLNVTGLISIIGRENVFSAYDIGKFKPDPGLFIYAANNFSVQNSEALVIEDTVPGIEAALAARMDVWAILHEGINDEILDFRIPVFRDFDEIKI